MNNKEIIKAYEEINKFLANLVKDSQTISYLYESDIQSQLYSYLLQNVFPEKLLVMPDIHMGRVYTELPLCSGEKPLRADIAVVSNDLKKIEQHIELQKLALNGKENQFGPLYSLPLLLAIEIKYLALDPKIGNYLSHKCESDLNKYNSVNKDRRLNYPEYLILVGVDQRMRQDVTSRYILEIYQYFEGQGYLKYEGTKAA